MQGNRTLARGPPQSGRRCQNRQRHLKVLHTGLRSATGRARSLRSIRPTEYSCTITKRLYSSLCHFAQSFIATTRYEARMPRQSETPLIALCRSPEPALKVRQTALPAPPRCSVPNLRSRFNEVMNFVVRCP
jgi:hypothetical protein